MTVENLILQNLIFNDEYSRKVVPFIQEEYFHDRVEREVLKEIKTFILRYSNLPTINAIKISLDKNKIFSEKEHEQAIKILESLKDEKQNKEWLIEETEKFCKDKAVYNAIMESIHIIDGKSKTYTENAIPNILSDALAVSFDSHIGHDYVEDSDSRYEFYHQTQTRIPFDLDYMNKITNGGTPTKTLNIVMAGTGVGKSLFLCHHAANCLMQNLNVLYITCEMAEERIAERIDANLLDITLDSLSELPYESYEKKLNSVTKGTSGKLIIKEYPTASASTNHFRILLDELKIKKQFKPDIIFVDYLNICASARLKQGSNVNSYLYIKAIAEELRGLAVEQNVPIFSATQLNRAGFTSTDVGLEDTSESFGLPATADFMIALISTEELDENNQIVVKQLKNRYNDTVVNRKFILGINRAKMKLSDVESIEQNLISVKTSANEEYGNGFDGKKYDDKFKIPEKERFSDWSI
jgi:replicative DNA helicase